ncbi:hypothetical protein [Kordiimonas sp. SCSIO 12610]|uniref:hypothetical protein n=1 Tax=Kordiimonas sp. SCSIO 12610 TaxID=2829597 RepID=UPI00210A3228|nr:hypothetical protein [Kordiimonas sp. SCSIO 12610]UTW53961.1 hypothetical protein KFF44_08915 [Kordiimonas sp. SCSIO 12610]
MTKNFIKNPNGPDTILPGQTSTSELPQSIMEQLDGITVDLKTGVNIMTLANQLNMIEKVELLVNYSVFAEISVADLQYLDRFYDEDVVDGELVWRFLQKNRKTLIGQESNSLILGAQPIMHLRLHFSDAAVGPTYRIDLDRREIRQQTADAFVAGGRENGALAITRQLRKFKNLNVPIDQVGQNTFTYNSDAQVVRGFHLIGANISKLKFYINNELRYDFENLRAVNRRLKSFEGGSYNPQPNSWHLVPEAFSGAAGDAWGVNPNDEFKFEITTTNTDDCTLLIEELKRPQSETNFARVAEAYQKAQARRIVAR